MMKCDFCTQSTADGKCPHTNHITREDYCKEAIDKMTKTFKLSHVQKIFKLRKEK